METCFKPIFDLQFGDKFSIDTNDKILKCEVVSPFGTSGIPDGDGYICQKDIQDNIVYAVDRFHRENILKFKSNIRVLFEGGYNETT